MKCANILSKEQNLASRVHQIRSDSLYIPIEKPNRTSKRVYIPLFAAKIPAGFPSPADDHLEAVIDLNRHYIRHPAATFFVRVKGHSMVGAGIQNNDMLVVDRSLEPRSGSIVIAVVNGELTVKRLLIDDNGVCLLPENPDYAPIWIQDFMDMQIWGVVAHVIHSF